MLADTVVIGDEKYVCEGGSELNVKEVIDKLSGGGTGVVSNLVKSFESNVWVNTFS